MASRDSLAARRTPSSLRDFRRSQDPRPNRRAAPDRASGAGPRELGLRLWQEGRLDEAARVLEEAARRASDDPNIFAELGCVQRLLGRKSEAMRSFLTSLSLDSKQARVWLNSANLSNENGFRNAAERAYLQALEIDPNCAEAAVGLGLLYVEHRKFRAGARLLSLAVELGAGSASILSCLGQAHYVLGEFTQAAAAFSQAIGLEPDNVAILQRLARIRLILAVISDSAEGAIEIYREIAGPHAEDIFSVCSAAFHLLGANGPREAAIRLGRRLLELKPGDPVIGYHLDVLMGLAHDRAPIHYLAASFDRLAPQFEKHLVEVLDYRVPTKIHSLLQGTGQSFHNILDLGCGTGLAAPLLAGFGGRLTGVDISSGMLREARQRGAYDRLVQAEALSFLAEQEENFDLVAALDVLIYFGDLAPLFDAVAMRLSSGGVFAFSHEMANCDSYRLLSSGRFAHAPQYIEALCGENFSIVASVISALRLENARPVVGRLTLLRRL